jgi:hypothetical protein
MKKIIILFVITLLSSCAGTISTSESVTNPSLKFHTTDLISLAVPTIFDGEIKYLNNSKTMSWEHVDSLPHDNTLLHSLSDILSSVTIYQTNKEGTLTLLGNSITAKNTTYKVIYDFTQTQTILLCIKNDSIKQSIGIAVRMIAEITTKKRGIDLSDIFKLSLNAEKEKISGSLTVRSVGISSQKVNQSIPTTTDLSPASIASALQTIATIKSSIYDQDTRITPYLIGFSIPGKSTKDDVKNELNKFSL